MLIMLTLPTHVEFITHTNLFNLKIKTMARKIPLPDLLHDFNRSLDIGSHSSLATFNSSTCHRKKQTNIDITININTHTTHTHTEKTAGSLPHNQQPVTTWR